MRAFSDADGSASWPHTRSLAALSSLVLCASGVACAPDTVTVRSHPQFAPHAITKVAIAPFRAFEGTQGAVQTFRFTPPDQDSSGIRRSLGGDVLSGPDRTRVTSVSIPALVPEAIRRMVYSRLTWRSHIQVSLTDTVPYAPQEGERAGEYHVQSPEQQSAVEAVLEGVVHVYREREGPPFAAISAAVGFELQLRDVRDGSVLWVGEYFEEQKPLTQDIEGFFARGGMMVTAEDLARDGVVRVLQRLPLGKE